MCLFLTLPPPPSPTHPFAIEYIWITIQTHCKPEALLKIYVWREDLVQCNERWWTTKQSLERKQTYSDAILGRINWVDWRYRLDLTLSVYGNPNEHGEKIS